MKELKNTIKVLHICIMILLGTTCTSQSIDGQLLGHEYIDLGLPSGTKWATHNIGSTKDTDYGEYYAWGELYSKKFYDIDNYKWYDEDKGLFIKYNYTERSKGEDILLELADDVANYTWGNGWRLPTKKECDELINGCLWTWIKDYKGCGISGYIGTSKTNGNTIFFPAAGYKELDDTMEFGEEAYYWTSTLYTSASFAYSFFPKNMGMSRRRWGLLVRAICK